MGRGLNSTCVVERNKSPTSAPQQGLRTIQQRTIGVDRPIRHQPATIRLHYPCERGFGARWWHQVGLSRLQGPRDPMNVTLKPLCITTARPDSQWCMLAAQFTMTWALNGPMQ